MLVLQAYKEAREVLVGRASGGQRLGAILFALPLKAPKAPEAALSLAQLEVCHDLMKELLGNALAVVRVKRDKVLADLYAFGLAVCRA